MVFCGFNEFQVFKNFCENCCCDFDVDDIESADHFGQAVWIFKKY